MPHKIAFKVVSASGEDDHHRAKELNAHGPTVHGWQSHKFCTYPQEITVQLETRVRLYKIQILSHQFLIASQIKISVGDVHGKRPDDDHFPTDLKYKQLGFISLSDNERTNFKARELKSIHVDVVGTYVRFLVHKNVPNRHNVCNQVGIVAINVIGKPVGPNYEIDELVDDTHASHSNKRDLYPAPGMIQRRADHISPLDDLTFDMYQDQEVAQVIRKLEVKKQHAVNQEKYEYAKRLKAAMTDLWKVGETLGKYEIEKQQAIAMEDYDKARRKKAQMEEYRVRIYDQLQIPALLEMDSEHLLKNHSLKKAKKPTLPLVPIKQVGVEMESASPTGTSNTETKDSSTGNDASSSESNSDLPHRKATNHHNHQQQGAVTHQPRDGEDVYGVHRESDDSRPSSDDWSKPVATPPAILSLPINSLGLTSKPIINSYVDHNETSLPSLARRRSTIDPADQPIRRGPRPQDSNITESDKRQAALPIEVFGMTTVQLAYSKLFSDREEAMDDVRQQLLDVQPSSDLPPAKVMRAASFLAQKGLKDIVLSVFSKSLDLLTVLLSKFPVQQKVPRSEIVNTLDKIIPELISKLGDKSVRLRTASQQYILELMDYPEVRPLPTIPQHCCQPLSPQLTPRSAQGQIELVEQLVHKLGIESNNGLTLNSVLTFCVPALQHPSGAVRESAERIIEGLYRMKGREVRKYLPPNDNSTRRNMIYRNLFETFDMIDDEDKKVVGNSREMPNAPPKMNGHPEQRKSSLANLPTPELVKRLEKACIFCGEMNQEFTNHGLDLHYWKQCPMLIRCHHCKQVVEIAEYVKHLLEECSAKDKYEKCKRCQEAIPKKEYEKHAKLRLCIPAKLDKSYSRCQLCHKNIGSGEKSWKTHLMGKNGCDGNLRRKSISGLDVMKKSQSADRGLSDPFKNITGHGRMSRSTSKAFTPNTRWR